MVSMLLTIAIGFAGAVDAKTSSKKVDIQPASGKKVCIARKYDEKHMKAHTGQKLNAMTIIIGEQPVDEKGSTSQKYLAARVVGESNGKLFGNEAGCEFQKDGSVKCSIDCDGGAFNLNPSQKEKSVLFTVAKDYYFPLFVQGLNIENMGDDDFNDDNKVLRLNFEDQENRTYKLYPTALPTCEEEWEKYKSEPISC